MNKNNVLDSLFGKPNYDGITKDSTVTVEITKQEMAVILEAYDCGLDNLDTTQVTELEHVISKLKDQLWP